MVDVSVIIPTYGTPCFLKSSIQSVINQTFKNWELIIIDDNNPDTEARKQTEAIISDFQKIEKRILYIKHKYNKNGAAARNTGFAAAKGKYISLLDSDDEYTIERLQKCYNVMEQASQNIAGVYTGCEYRKGGKVYHVDKRALSGNFLINTLACNFKFSTGSNIFFRKSVVDELNGFDPKFLRHQDYEFLVRAFKKYSLAGISEVLVIKNNENINLPSVEKMIVIKEQYLNKFKDIINSLPQKHQEYIYHTQYILVAEAALRSNKKSIAKKYYKLAGSLTMNEFARKMGFTLINLFKYKWIYNIVYTVGYIKKQNK